MQAAMFSNAFRGCLMIGQTLARATTDAPASTLYAISAKHVQVDLRTDFTPQESTAGESEPSLGSHVVTPRRGYLHHGIYVGDGKVVHYAGLADSLRPGPVEEISLARFTRGRAVWVVVSNAPSNFDCQEVTRRARSRVGEDRYRLLSNNCEHFCEWCLHAEHRSYQVEALLAYPGRALHSAIRLLKRLCSVAAAGIGLFAQSGEKRASRGYPHPSCGYFVQEFSRRNSVACQARVNASYRQ
jgi:hypothetical protein